MEADQHNLVLKEEEEEKEEEAALQRRQYRRSDDNNNAIAAVVLSTNGNGNGNGMFGSFGSSDSSIESDTANGTGHESPSKDVGEDGRLLNSVYFDQHQGTEPTDGVFKMKNGSVTSSIFGMNSRDTDVHIKNLEVQKSLIEETNDQHGANFDDKGFSGSSLTLSKESHGDIKSKPINNEARLGGDFDIIEEPDQEETEFDVERVLEKQNTHDLYCPNCSSCITRRVILHRRKPKIRHARRKPKNNKSETDFHPELDSVRSNSGNLQVHESVNNQSSGSPAIAADANNSDPEPEIFRCLSCFSFFIPTGDGFKLFRHFGDSSITEDRRMQNLQKTPTTNKNWFSSIFSTDKKKTTVDQDHISSPCKPSKKGNQCNDNLAARNETQIDQNDIVSSIVSPPMGLVNNFGSASVEVGEEIANSSKQENEFIENTSYSVQEETDNVIEKSEIGHAAPDNDLVDAFQQFNSKSSSDTVLHQQRLHSEASVTDIIGESSSRPLQGGVIFPLSTTCEPLVPGQSLIEAGKNVNKAMPEEQPVQNDHVPLVQGTPQPTLFGKREPLDDSFVVCHETPKDAIFSSSRGTQILDKLKIGVGETAYAAVGNKIPGGDVIVTVETKSGAPAAPQMAQNVDGSLEATSLLLSGSHMYINEERGAEVTVDILKSIVYGGLIESITSLGVVSSAAGAGSATWNILALGLANLIGGLFIIGHNLIELKNDTSGSSNQTNEHKDRYQETLGRRENFLLHATVSILSFLIFGILPPVIYGFSFRKSDNRDLKLAAVGGASLLCIIVLAIGKAYTRRQPKHYISTLLYYVSIGIVASGASYIVGDLIAKLVEKVGLSESILAVPETIPMDLPWASH
ncbi:membrane protein of ER body-like protein isoform X4 [Manihot esculenta]|uniref:membrane protein of ER body-like protein isoform X4 n=1 Tax=Manihot esculenta TaxID=3983 RepID=UPI001CC41C10|nr:membrane protein of ER body-like protein isoform X4 [Manihot esculenta]